MTRYEIVDRSEFVNRTSHNSYQNYYRALKFNDQSIFISICNIVLCIYLGRVRIVRVTLNFENCEIIAIYRCKLLNVVSGRNL